MSGEIKVQCQKCEKFYYLQGEELLRIPTDANPGDIFGSKCPSCGAAHASLEEKE